MARGSCGSLGPLSSSSPFLLTLPSLPPPPTTILSEQTKLALLKLQTEEFLQSIAELCGQPRKPQIPKEAPTAVRDELKLKIRVSRVSSHVLGEYA